MNKLNTTLKQTGIALAVAQAFVVNASSAARITVNDGGDAGAGCTFREAAAIVNAGSDQVNGCIIDTSNGPLGTNDTIEFNVVDDSVTLNSDSGAVLIDSDVSINTNGGAVTIAGDNASIGFRYDINGLLIIRDADVSIENATLTNGAAFYGGAGAVSVVSGSQLTLINTTIVDNVTLYGAGGIYVSASTIILNNSTVSKNNSLASIGRGAGGILAIASSNVILSNSTVSGNSGISFGGISSYRAGTVTLNNSTVSGNYGFFVGGIRSIEGMVTSNNSTVYGNSNTGIYTYRGTVTLNNSIIAGNRNDDVYGINSFASELDFTNSTLIANGNNLLGDNSETSESAFFGVTPSFANIIATSDGNNPTSLTNILAPLADNGGPTLTHALVAGSPAINRGNNSICAAAPINNLDQRGKRRPVGSNCDIGSFEGALESATPEPETNFFVVSLPNGNSVIFSL